MTYTNTPDQETDPGPAQNQPSDARVILGPLVKYAAMGFVLVGIIVTTAVMLDRQFNTIDQEVAALQARLEKAHTQAETTEVNTVDTVADTREPEPAATAVLQARPAPVAIEAASQQAVKKDTTAAVANRTEMAPVQNTTGNEPKPGVSLASTADNESVVQSNSNATDPGPAQSRLSTLTWQAEDTLFDRGMDDFIADRNAYLNERDQVYLERLRDGQLRQLQLMRERMARHEQRLREMEQRYRELYDIRAADLEEMQERREHFLPDRI